MELISCLFHEKASLVIKDEQFDCYKVTKMPHYKMSNKKWSIDGKCVV